MILWCSLLFPGGWGQISLKMVKNQLLASLFKGLRINLFVNAYGKTKWIEQKWRSPKRWIFLRITASSGGKLVFKNTHFFNKGPLLGKFNPICRHLFHPGRMDHEKSKFDYNWIKCIWGFIIKFVSYCKTYIYVYKTIKPWMCQILKCKTTNTFCLK